MTVLVLFFGLMIFIALYLRREGNRIKDGSHEAYTICTVTGVYFGAKFSRNIEFYLDSIRLEDHCTTGECGNSKLGTRYFIKTWRGHTDYWEIIYDTKVPQDLVAPAEGWDKMPVRPMGKKL